MFYANHVAADAVSGKSNMPGDKERKKKLRRNPIEKRAISGFSGLKPVPE